MIKSYENEMFYFLRKPSKIPSTMWNQFSFLEKIIENWNNEIKKIIKSLSEYWTKENEYWLINRLDNETSWLLYFAKFPYAKELYKKKQAELKLKKNYIADINWDIRFFLDWKKSVSIETPIAHHKFLSDRMVAIKESEKVNNKTRWKYHHVKTKIKFLYYDEQKQSSTVKLTIQKWIRHQIRCHLSSIWYPIIWDEIYNKRKVNENLHLRSIWFKIKL